MGKVKLRYPQTLSTFWDDKFLKFYDNKHEFNPKKETVAEQVNK